MLTLTVLGSCPRLRFRKTHCGSVGGVETDYHEGQSKDRTKTTESSSSTIIVSRERDEN